MAQGGFLGLGKGLDFDEKDEVKKQTNYFLAHPDFLFLEALSSWLQRKSFYLSFTWRLKGSPPASQSH
jgi:hypothetical protein